MSTSMGSSGVRIEIYDKSGYSIVENPNAVAGVVGFSPKGELNKIIHLKNTANQDSILGFGFNNSKYNQGMYAARAVLTAGGHVDFVRPYGEEIDPSDPYKRDLKSDCFVVTYDRNAYRDDYPYAHNTLNVKHFASTRYKTDAAAEYGVTRKINNIAETVTTGMNYNFAVSAGEEFKDSNACRWYDSTKRKMPTDTVLFAIMNTDPSSAKRAFASYEVADTEYTAGSSTIVCTVTSKPGFVVGDVVYLPVSNPATVGTSTKFATAEVVEITDYDVSLNVLTEDYFSSGAQKPNTIIYCDRENAVADGADYLSIKTAVAGRGVKTFTTLSVGDFSGNTAYSKTTSVRNGQYLEVFDTMKNSAVVRFVNDNYNEDNRVKGEPTKVEGAENTYTIALDNTDSILVGDTVVATAAVSGVKISYTVLENDTSAEQIVAKCINPEDLAVVTLSGAKLSVDVSKHPDNGDSVILVDITTCRTWDDVADKLVAALKDDSIGYTNNLVANDIKSFETVDGVRNVIKVDPSAATEYAIGDVVAVVRGQNTFNTTDVTRGATEIWDSVLTPSTQNSLVTGTIANLNVLSGEITLVADDTVINALAKVPEVAYTTEVGDVVYTYQLIDISASTQTTYNAKTTESWSVTLTTPDNQKLGYSDLIKNEYSSELVEYTKINNAGNFITQCSREGICQIESGDVLSLAYPEYGYASLRQFKVYMKQSPVPPAAALSLNSDDEEYRLAYSDGTDYFADTTMEVIDADDIDSVEELSERKVFTEKYVLGISDSQVIYTAKLNNELYNVSADGLLLGPATVRDTKYVTVGFTVKDVNTAQNTITGSAIVSKDKVIGAQSDKFSISLTKSASVDYADVYVIGSYSMYVASAEQDSVQIVDSEANSIAGDFKTGFTVNKGILSGNTRSAIAERSSKVLADSSIGQTFLGLGLAKVSIEDVDFTGDARQVYVLNDDGVNVARLYLGIKYMFNGTLYEFEGTVVPYVYNDIQLSIIDAADAELTNSGAKFVLNESGVLDSFLDNNAYDLSQTVVNDVLNGSVTAISFNMDDPAIVHDAVWSYSPLNNRSASTLSTVWNLFLDKDNTDVTFLVAAGNAINNLFMKDIETLNTQVISAMLTICEARKDCFALFDGVGEQKIETALKKAVPATGFGANYGRWGFIYDSRGVVFDSVYTKGNVEIVKSVQMASLITSNRAGGTFWYVPSGPLTGRVPSAWGTREKYPRRFSYPEDPDSDIARLSNLHMNPTRTTTNGTFFWGDYTMQMEDTAFNQVHVTMLMAGINKMFYKYLDTKVFQLNTAALRADIQSTLQARLDSIKNGTPAGFYEAECICDDTNNTPEIIDQNKLYVDIRVKPTKSCRYIYLRSTVLSTSDGNQVTTELT